MKDLRLGYFSRKNRLNIAHPWHGIDPGKDFPKVLTAYIEITPFDTVKYELDKSSGLLKIDRPQQFSNLCPALYGFVPATYCGRLIGELCTKNTGKPDINGDGDPLDICILSEKPISNNNILIDCIPIGGLLMIDNNEADDKIIAVMKNDLVYGSYTDIHQLPQAIIDRLKHYFSTYKVQPEKLTNPVIINEIYDSERAKEVLLTAQKDYQLQFRNQ